MFKKGEMNLTISENSMFIHGVSYERNIRACRGSYSKRDNYCLQTGVFVDSAKMRALHRDEIYFEHIPKPL